MMALSPTSTIRSFFRFVAVAFVVCAIILIVVWLFLAPPGTDSLFARLLYAIASILVFVWLRKRIGWLAIALVVLAIVPITVTLVTGLKNYLDLDSASYAEEDWKIRNLPGGRHPLVVHLSDPHFIGKSEGKTYEGKDWNVDVLENTVIEVLALRPKFVIVSGDITDRGASDEWEQAENVLIMPLAKVGIELILAPGNHDLQPYFERQEKGAPALRRGRPMSAYLNATSRYTAGLQSSDGSPLERRMSWTPPSEAEIKRVQDQWFQCMTDCPMEGIRGCQYGCNQWLDEQVLSFEKYVEVQDACGTWYPMVRFEKESGSMFIVLCSNRTLVETLGTNAVGELGDKQVAGLRSALDSLPVGTRRIFVVLHHNVVKRPNDRFGLPAGWNWKAISESSVVEFATMPNRLPESLEVVQILRAAAMAHPEVLVHVAFGHRHVAFQGKVDQRDGGPHMWISEAPAAYDPDGGIWIGYESLDSKRMEWRWWSNGK